MYFISLSKVTKIKKNHLIIYFGYVLIIEYKLVILFKITCATAAKGYLR